MTDGNGPPRERAGKSSVVSHQSSRISMLKALKSLLEETSPKWSGAQERRHLHAAVASLLHEATRVDLDEAEVERAAAERALADLFGLDAEESAAVLAEGRAKAQQLTSYFGPVSVIKRDLGQPERA